MNELMKIKSTFGFSGEDVDYACKEGENTIYILKNGNEISFSPTDFAEKILDKLGRKEATNFIKTLLDKIPHEVNRRLKNEIKL